MNEPMTTKFNELTNTLKRIEDKQQANSDVNKTLSDDIRREAKFQAAAMYALMEASELTWFRADKDGYTIRTADGKKSAHFEHTIAVTETGVDPVL